MGRHVDKLKQTQPVVAKKQNIQAEIEKSKVIKELSEKIGNLELVIEELTDKINKITTKPNKQIKE